LFDGPVSNPSNVDTAMATYVLTLRLPDRPGIVHAVSGALLACGGNILENAQFSEPVSGLFCLRTRFETANPDLEQLRHRIAEATDSVAAGDAVHMSLRDESVRRRVLLMVSKHEHCLLDLLYRHDEGELPIDIPLVVSNHWDCQELVARYGIPYVHIPVTKTTKQEAEDRLLALIGEHQIDFVVLARYMQVLSEGLCHNLAGRAINIHHSFLPGFKGAKPYHQAHDRGVKVIGATAHYVTSDLDEGPIIEQDVQRVNHAQSADQLVVIGKDIERQVLSRAVRWQAEDRVLLVGHRTVVFN
jgi:formyltetrahydrofolate deformylase